MSSVTAHEWSLSGMSRRWESLSLAGSGIRGQTRVGVLRIEGILLHLYPRGYASTWGRGCPRVRGVDMGRSLVLRPLDYVTKLVSGLLTCKLPLDVNPVAIHATVRSE